MLTWRRSIFVHAFIRSIKSIQLHFARPRLRVSRTEHKVWKIAREHEVCSLISCLFAMLLTIEHVDNHGVKGSMLSEAKSIRILTVRTLTWEKVK